MLDCCFRMLTTCRQVKRVAVWRLSGKSSKQQPRPSEEHGAAAEAAGDEAAVRSGADAAAAAAARGAFEGAISEAFEGALKYYVAEEQKEVG